jgi:hypothetical protein
VTSRPCQQHDVLDALVAYALGEGREVVEPLAHLLGHGQPAQAVGHLGLAGGAPQRVVLAPDAPGDVLLGSLLDARGHARLDVLVGQ